MSCNTLYFANAIVRWLSVTVAGSTDCSTTSAAPRSRPMPLTMPRNAANPRVSGDVDTASSTAPHTVSAVMTNSVRRRPKRSEKNVTSSVPNAAPASPSPMTTPMAFASSARLAR